MSSVTAWYPPSLFAASRLRNALPETAGGTERRRQRNGLFVVRVGAGMKAPRVSPSLHSEMRA